jgi:hypothetical protein
MYPLSPPLEKLHIRDRELKAHIAQLGEMRPGSLVECYRKCGSSFLGVVEAGCKGVIGTRLKRGGMPWTVRGANAVIALRCCKLSSRFEDFWEQRSGARNLA